MEKIKSYKNVNIFFNKKFLIDLEADLLHFYQKKSLPEKYQNTAKKPEIEFAVGIKILFSFFIGLLYCFSPLQGENKKPAVLSQLLSVYGELSRSQASTWPYLSNQFFCKLAENIYYE